MSDSTLKQYNTIANQLHYFKYRLYT